MPVDTISSPRNHRYVRWKKYAHNPQEESCPWLPVWGWKQVFDLIQVSNLQLLLLSQHEHPLADQLQASARQTVFLPPSLFKRLSGLQNPQGCLGFFVKPKWCQQDLHQVILYLEGIQDPGNVGTLIRTAAALGRISLVSSPATVSFFNPKVVRASVGLLYLVPFLEDVELEALTKGGYQTWLLDPHKGVPLFEAQLRAPLLAILGNEGSGPCLHGKDLFAQRIRIPMTGPVDSLNVAVSGALLMYEALRKGTLDGGIALSEQPDPER
jgi:TrmH family RNA methyltransferase